MQCILLDSIKFSFPISARSIYIIFLCTRAKLVLSSLRLLSACTCTGRAHVCGRACMPTCPHPAHPCMSNHSVARQIIENTGTCVVQCK
ncbi:hypothetical protein PUN28_009636 [Cardiocondyla obscurior]|uniref:Secreted protein n=1 Tax=Cardiocondyla obscurior TaxID=286306 RepID=A0AAW2FVC9_9HYME